MGNILKERGREGGWGGTAPLSWDDSRAAIPQIGREERGREHLPPLN